ncbi:HAD family hydrolase [Streptomyces sp. NPDC054796]
MTDHHLSTLAGGPGSALPVLGPEGPIRRGPVSRRPAPPLRAVLFDFSGTLFQIAPYSARIRAAVTARELDDAAMDEVLTGLEAGLSDPEVVAAQQGRDVSAKAHRHAFTTWYASVPLLAPVAEELYEQLRTPRYWLPYADSGATLFGLRRRGIAVGVVSDVGWDLRPTFAHHGLDDYIGSWTHSYEHDTEKPDPALFLHACEQLGVEPAETLMVGDHPAKDGGAVGAGLRAYVLPSGAAPGAHRGLAAVTRLTDAS